MKPTDDNLRNLLGMLRAVHMGNDLPPVEANWQQTVMRRIRRLSERQRRPSFLQAFEPLVWRLAPVTSVMIVVCVVTLMRSGLIGDWQLFQLLFSGLAETLYFDF